MTLWSRSVVRKCRRGVFVKEACRCVQAHANPDIVAPENVVNGKKIKIEEAPWTVVIEATDAVTNERRFICAGALLASRWAVTARHCVDNYSKDTDWRPPIDPRVRAGVSLRRDRADMAALSPFTAFFPPDTGEDKICLPDLALLLLNRSIQASGKRIQYIPLATDYKSYIEHYCSVSGLWGCTLEGKDPAVPTKKSYLQRVKQFPLRTGDNRCLEIVDFFLDTQADPICAVDPKVLPDCTAGTKKASGVCPGDSGSPLVCPDPSGRPVLLGVMSAGPENCFRGGPGAYTNIPALREFMERIMENNP